MGMEGAVTLHLTVFSAVHFAVSATISISAFFFLGVLHLHVTIVFAA